MERSASPRLSLPVVLRIAFVLAISLLAISLCDDAGAEPRVTPAKAASTPAAVSLRPPAHARSAEGTSCKLADTDDPSGFYRSEPWEKGEVVLTFDDGPHPGHTPKVLDLLAQHQLTATFFLVGRNIDKKSYGLVQRMLAEGHSIGLHSYNHDVKMAVRKNGEKSIEYIRGQHEVTQILVDLALLAKSEQDFDALYTRVFGVESGKWLEASALRKDWRTFAERNASVLAERGFSGGRRPYAALYTRPPAGTPYVGGTDATQKQQYGSAIERGGWLNVMWHGESGDTHPTKKHDLGFLTSNLKLFSRRGGVLLIHDYVRKDALKIALSAMLADPQVRIVPIESAVQKKFGCGSAAVAAALDSAASSADALAAASQPGGRS